MTDDYQKAYEQLKRIHNSANEAIASLQRQIEGLQKQIEFFTGINASLEQKVMIQKNIIDQSLTDFNYKTEEQAQEVQRLRGIIQKIEAENK